MGHYPQVGKKGKENGQNRQKQPRGIKVVKVEDIIVGRATNIQGHKETI